MDDTSRSPLSLCRVSEGAPLGGVIKARPEDFLVDELPLYDPSGAGEHLYLGIEKRDATHHDLLRCLCQHFGVRDGDIGFAGMKDRYAITRQAVSIHLPGKPDGSIELGDPRFNVVWAKRHVNKLRRGHLAGNRFAIRVRSISAVKAPEVYRRVQVLEKHGAPNTFGPQRFGNRLDNHLLGLALLRQDWQGFLDQLAGSGGRTEHFANRALAQGRPARAAVLSLGGPTLDFMVNALQSAIFNAVVDERVRAGMFTSLVEGDLAFKHDSGAVFAVTAADCSSDSELPGRLSRLEISPSGPLHGTRMTQPEGIPLQIEQECMRSHGLDPGLFADNRHAPDGARRSMRIAVTHASVEGGCDEHGEYVRIAFDLPAGAFATVVLRELLGDSESHEELQ